MIVTIKGENRLEFWRIWKKDSQKYSQKGLYGGYRQPNLTQTFISMKLEHFKKVVGNLYLGLLWRIVVQMAKNGQKQPKNLGDLGL